MMVSEILAAANLALGGGSGFDYSTLNDLVSLLNQGFDNCYPSGWVQDHLTPSSGGGDDGVVVGLVLGKSALLHS